MESAETDRYHTFMAYRTELESDQAIERLFRRKRTVQIGDLQEALDTTSRMTIWRHLRRHEYLTSFTDKGAYYTLSSIPEFDANGLWFHQGVGFSKYGTLKDTVANLVEAAESGRTQRELRKLVVVRVHEALLALINAKRVSRKMFPAEYLYVSVNHARSEQQLARRAEIMETSGTAKLDLPLPLVVEILLEIVRRARTRVVPARLASWLQGRGIDVSEEDVECTMEHFGIDKKKRDS